MSDGVRAMLDHGRELRLLADLCRELAKLDVKFTLSDARPAVRVRVGGNWAGLSVLMDSEADLFTWSDEQTHTISDRAGAAAAIATYVKASGERCRAARRRRWCWVRRRRRGFWCLC